MFLTRTIARRRAFAVVSYPTRWDAPRSFDFCTLQKRHEMKVAPNALPAVAHSGLIGFGQTKPSAPRSHGRGYRASKWGQRPTGGPSSTLGRESKHVSIQATTVPMISLQRKMKAVRPSRPERRGFGRPLRTIHGSAEECLFVRNVVSALWRPLRRSADSSIMKTLNRRV
jgi:hypothetical protein